MRWSCILHHPGEMSWTDREEQSLINSPQAYQKLEVQITKLFQNSSSFFLERKYEEPKWEVLSYVLTCVYALLQHQHHELSSTKCSMSALTTLIFLKKQVCLRYCLSVCSFKGTIPSSKWHFSNQFQAGICTPDCLVITVALYFKVPSLHTKWHFRTSSRQDLHSRLFSHQWKSLLTRTESTQGQSKLQPQVARHQACWNQLNRLERNKQQSVLRKEHCCALLGHVTATETLSSAPPHVTSENEKKKPKKKGSSESKVQDFLRQLFSVSLGAEELPSSCCHRVPSAPAPPEPRQRQHRGEREQR